MNAPRRVIFQRDEDFAWYASLSGKTLATVKAKLEQIARDPYGLGSFAKVEDPPTRLRMFYAVGFRFEYVLSLDEAYVIVYKRTTLRTSSS